MSSLSISRRIFQKGITPFLGYRRQYRIALLHEILHEQEPVFQEFLARGEPWAHGEIQLTFDDGFYSSYRAIRSLKRRKAIFFVCPNFINAAKNTGAWQSFFHNNLLRTERFIDPWFRDAVRPASWDDLRELVNLGHTIGSHTMNHACLSKITSQKELEREIIGSAEMIEDRLQIKVESFAYPFGNAESVNERAYSIIKKRYRRCFSGVRGNNNYTENASLIWRDSIHFDWPMDYIEFLLKGGFDWYYWSRRNALRRVARGI